MKTNKSQVEYVTDPAIYFDLLTSEALDVSIKNMVRGIGPDVITVTDPHKICRNKETKSIVSRIQSKDYRVVYTKQVIVDDFKTIPYCY